MSNNNNNFKFNIPLGAIIVAWFIAPPLGIALTVLYIISESGKNKSSSGEFSAKKARAEFEEKISEIKTAADTKKKTKKKKSESRNVLLLKIGAVALAAAAALFAVATVITVSDIYTFPELLLNIVAAGASLIGSIGLFLRSKNVKEQKIRLSRIRALIGQKESYSLTKIASASGTSIKTVRKDVQKLIDSGEFGSVAYIDLGKNYFMRSPDVAESFDAEQSSHDIPADSTSGEENFGLNADNHDFRSIIRDIRRLNDEIEDREVSERIFRIEEHTKNIFNFVSDHPEAKPQIRTFLNYYLPTTLKLLESYSRIEKVGVAGENMKKSKENIESTLDMLETAFKLQIDDLFKSESIDISSDISVLETMISKDGLDGKHDFDVDSGGAAAQEK